MMRGLPRTEQVFMPTIALVDDDRNILTSVFDRTRSRGLPHHDLHGRRLRARWFSRPSPPDLAILDIKMPRMDGMETLRRLRQKSDMPVIFLTSKDEEIDELFGLKMGADDFIREAVLAAACWVERREGGAAPHDPRRTAARPKEVDARALGARPAAHGPRAPHLHVERTSRSRSPSPNS